MNKILNNKSYIRKELDVQKNLLCIGKHSFRRHSMAYKTRYTVALYNNRLYVELYDGATTDSIEETLHNLNRKKKPYTVEYVEIKRKYHDFQGDEIPDPELFQYYNIMESNDEDTEYKYVTSVEECSKDYAWYHYTAKPEYADITEEVIKTKVITPDENPISVITTVIGTDTLDKIPQFHKPIGYIIIGKTLTNELIQRVQEILRYGHKVRLITDDINIMYKSAYSLQSELDHVYYATDGIMANRIKQSPFLCELPSTYNPKGAELLEAYRQQHRDFVFNYVYDLTSELYQSVSEEQRETRYERAARATYYSNYYFDQYLKHPKAPVILARLSQKARAYGFDLRLEEGQPTVDKFQPAEHIFPKKPTAFSETSETIWDTGNVDKALVTVRQKQKISELPSSNREIYEAIETVAWMEKHEDMYLDNETTFKCRCGYPMTIQDFRCPACDTKNHHYLVEFTAEDDVALDIRIEEMRSTEVKTYKIK